MPQWLPQPVSMAEHTAKFTVLEGTGANTSFTVQFNPASLEYSITSQLDERNGANAARQSVKKTSGKLTLALVFDTTDTGCDVREVTANVSGLLEPDKRGTKKYAPKVQFEWGTYSFKGVLEQYKETLDFFSADGVPLRATVNLTLAEQRVEFQSNRSPSPSIDHDLPEPVSVDAGTAPADAASASGDPRAARSIASASGAASLRFGGGAGLSVGGGVSLGAAASFSSGAGVGVGVGMGGGLSIGATAGAAFAGLRVSTPGATVSVASARAGLLSAPGVSGAASFGPGGRARVKAGGSLSADVGATAELNARIGFDA